MDAPRHDDLPPYLSQRTCPKCRGHHLSVGYRQHRPLLSWTLGMLDEITTHGADTGGECLLRTCDTCNWAWLEACDDRTRDSQDAAPVDLSGRA